MSEDDYTVEAAVLNGRPQRLVTIERTDGTTFRDNLNVDSAVSRKRFIGRAAEKFEVETEELDWLDDAVVDAADEADSRADEILAGEPARKSQATQLVELASDAELFHDADGEAFARFAVDGHFEVAAVRSKRFRQWMARLFYQTEGKAPSSQAKNDAIGVLEGRAVFEGTEHTVHVRIAGHDGTVFVDLCNGGWQVIEISSRGWSILDESPIMFRRAKAMLALPEPVRGGSVGELRQFINIADADWTLFVSWLIAAFQPSGPYPVLNVQGEHGSGKSTACRMARALVDPNTAMLRSEPREPRDLMIAASNGWVLSFDNISGISAWLSDCLCRLSTGGGFSTRTLYENDEETIFNSQRPVIINGIDEVATRSDLLDRCLLINLPRIDQVQRHPESPLWKAFERARPRIFGALLSAVAKALERLPCTKLRCLPRMADFAVWATAAEDGLGFQSGQFMTAYTANREAGNELAIDASPVGKSLTQLVEQSHHWAGSPTELLAELESRTPDSMKKMKNWPKNASSLGSTVKRIAPNLREAGIAVEFGHEGRGRGKRRVIQLTRTSKDSSVPGVPDVPTPVIQDFGGDGGDGNEPSGDGTGTRDAFDVTPYVATTGTCGDGGDAEFPTESSDLPQHSTLRGLCTGRLTPQEEQRLRERERTESVN